MYTTVLVGICSAARLENTYLPPNGAQGAGGGPGLAAPRPGGNGAGGPGGMLNFLTNVKGCSSSFE